MSVIQEQARTNRDGQVARWRYDELMRAGYSEPEAIELALRREIDLHLACDLLRRSCPPELAVSILT